MYEHSDLCEQRFLANRIAQQKWIAKYPKYCPHCNGEGSVYWQENLGPIGEVWMAPMSDICNCMENGNCPRCGEVVVENSVLEWDEAVEIELEDFINNEKPCPHCGWNWTNNPDDTKPDYECYGECNDGHHDFDVA